MKTIVVTNSNDEVLCFCNMNIYSQDNLLDYITIVEPADNSIKLEVFNFEPIFIDNGDGTVKLSRQKFLINKTDLY